MTATSMCCIMFELRIWRKSSEFCHICSSC